MQKPPEGIGRLVGETQSGGVREIKIRGIVSSRQSTLQNKVGCIIRMVPVMDETGDNHTK